MVLDLYSRTKHINIHMFAPFEFLDLKTAAGNFYRLRSYGISMSLNLHASCSSCVIHSTHSSHSNHFSPLLIVSHMLLICNSPLTDDRRHADKSSPTNMPFKSLLYFFITYSSHFWCNAISLFPETEDMPFLVNFPIFHPFTTFWLTSHSSSPFLRPYHLPD